MNSKDTYIAIGALILAVLAWTGAVLFYQNIGAAEVARVTDIQNSQQSSTQQGALLRMHAIAQDTTQDRAQLDQLLSTGVGSVATMLRGVGKATKVDVKLSDAISEASPPPAPSGPQIEAVGFALQGEGSFAALMRTEQLLENLPLASVVKRFDIQRSQVPGGVGSDVWHMSVYIIVYTTSDISS